jgi:hypothetical protein
MASLAARSGGGGGGGESMQELMDWASTQGHILSGGGVIEERFVEGRDYVGPTDLPHYHLTEGQYWRAKVR